jgi:uncharacterized membrane protein YkvA (DUF1232 family)
LKLPIQPSAELIDSDKHKAAKSPRGHPETKLGGGQWTQAWKHWAAAVKKDTYALYLAARDPRVPVVATLVVVLVVAYALSPIDLIPDFIPVLGYLDDVLLLPIGIALAIKLMPRDVWEDCKNQARAELVSELPRNRTAAIVIAMAWLALLGLAAWWFWSFWANR